MCSSFLEKRMEGSFAAFCVKHGDIGLLGGGQLWTKSMKLLVQFDHDTYSVTIYGVNLIEINSR